MKLFSFLFLAVSLFGQVTVSAQAGNSRSTQLNLVNKSTTTFNLSNSTASPAGAVSLNLSASTTRQQVQPIALGFTVSWPTADASGVSVAAGPALAGTGKNVSCSPSGSTLVCTVSGGTGTIPNGVAGIVNATINKSTQFTMSAVSATNKFGVPLLTAITPGGTATAVSLLASISCASPDIEPGEQVVCTATLNQPAATGGVTVQLTSSGTSVVLVNAGGTAVTSVIIPAGATSGTFIAKGT